MSQRCRKVVSKLHQSCFKDVSKLSQSCTKVVSNLFQSCTKVVSKMSQSCTKVVVFCLVLLLEKSNRYEWGSDENYIWSSSIRRRGWKWRLDRAWWRASLWSRPFHHCSPGRSRVSETSKVVDLQLGQSSRSKKLSRLFLGHFWPKNRSDNCLEIALTYRMA